MTKALVTIEVDFDTWGIPTQEGLGESSNPEHPPMRRINEAKRDFIWDEIHQMLVDKNQFVQIKKVSLIKKANKDGK